MSAAEQDPRNWIVDPQTGLFNRRFLQATLDRETARAERHALPLAMLLVDVDHLKAVNDAHGHVVGDRVLKFIAAQMAKVVRKNDFVFRFGGDEFAVLLPHTTLEGAADVKKRLKD